MNIYAYEDYKELLQSLFSQHKLDNKSFTLAQLAKACEPLLKNMIGII